jgi:hypothetical protein
MKRIILLVLISIIGIANVFSQASGNEIYSKRETYDNKYLTELPPTRFSNRGEIFLEANVLYNARADKYIAIFNVNQLGETAEIATQMVDSRINGVKQEFLKLGIKEIDFFC